MRKIVFTLFGVCCVLTACKQQNNKEMDMDFVDNVKVALANDGQVDLNSLQWTREPAGFEVKGDSIIITTAPPHRPVATDVLSLPERQRARAADEDS